VNAIVDALGLTLKDLRVPSSTPPHASPNDHKRIAAIYDYCDAQGNLVHETLRYEPKDFRQRRPDPTQPGAYLWSLKGIEPVLYHLPSVLQAKATGEIIYLCEGEKDADALTALGLTATCNAMGAGKWRDSYSQTLSGAHVIILPDNDQAGKDHTSLVKRSLQGKAASVQVVELPGLPDKGDVSDWLKAGGTREQLEAFAQAPAGSTPEDPTSKPLSASLVSFDELMQLQIPERKLYMDWLKERSIVMVYGPRGVGKTMQLLGLSISLATGKPFLKWAVHQSVGVLYVDGEMSLAELGVPGVIRVMPSMT
jgi:5S rRNA maturation endonuclease (ribonuclease M5)